MREIKLSKGMVAFVDDQDYEKLKDYRWHAVKNNARHENRDIYYARRWQVSDERYVDNKGRTQYKKTAIYMHREVLGLPPERNGLVPDHKDYNGLNNQRSNLQVISHSENLKRKRRQQRFKLSTTEFSLIQ